MGKQGRWTAFESYKNPTDYLFYRENPNISPDARSIQTALEAAAAKNNSATLNYLIQAGAPVNTEPTGNSWRSALQAAVGGGDVK